MENLLTTNLITEKAVKACTKQAKENNPFQNKKSKTAPPQKKPL
jgi:hypothetical protein